MRLRGTPLALLVTILFSFIYTVSSQNGQSDLNVHLTSGGYDNFLWRTNTTATQILLTNPNTTDRPQRFVAALPAGNSGALSYFLPLNGSNQLSVQLVDGSLQDATGDFDNVGVQGRFTFSADATLGVTILGAVRAMRDYVEGRGTMHEIFNYTVATMNASYIHLHRPWISSTHSLDYILGAQSNVIFEVTPSNNGTFTPPTINFRLQNPASPGIVSWKVLCNETTIPALGTSQVFINESEATNPASAQALQKLAGGMNVDAQELSFMVYQSKSLAGGWRFLTYFGRDTLIAVRLLMPLFTPEASESVLGAVLERLNSTGAACHEETIGDYAAFINIQNNMPQLGDTPFYDYKMIDTDLYLLPTIAHYFLNIPQGRGRAQGFLARKATLRNPNMNQTYHDLLARNAAYIFDRTTAFAEKHTVANLLHLRPGQHVGNWRDSDVGLGWGSIPFDVNVGLVPAALRAIADLTDAGILDPGSKNMGTLARHYADMWEKNAPPLFEVSVSAATAMARLKDFVSRESLSDALLADQNGSSTNPVDFYALSLHDDGTPVDIMHSDLGFSLLYAPDVSGETLRRVVSVLQPYPKGLLTNIGMLVTNPALSANRSQADVLNRAAYHGTVIWSFQQALMAAGLARQLKLCDNSTLSIDVVPPPDKTPSWCRDTALVSSVKEAQTRLWQSINGGQSQLFSEVWSYSFDSSTNRFDIADLVSLTQGVESDAIQFWSFTFLAVADPTAGGQ